MEMLQGRMMLRAAYMCMPKEQDKALGLHW